MYSFGLSLALSQGGVEVIPDNEPTFFADSSRRSVARQLLRNLHLSHANQPMFYPSRRFSGFQGRSGCLKTEQGRSCWQEFSRGFSDCHTEFGYVFYDDMNKKPVAQSQFQHYLLGFRTVHGLLSRLRTAIVVNCFTLNKI
jgi:hypothetical protein